MNDNDNETFFHIHNNDDRELIVQELWIRIKFLKAQVIEIYQSSIVQSIAISKKMRKSSLFKEESKDRDNRTIHVFLDIMNNYLKIDMIESFEKFKIYDLVSFLKNIMSREYHNRVKNQDSFIIYDIIKV